MLAQQRLSARTEVSAVNAHCVRALRGQRRQRAQRQRWPKTARHPAAAAAAGTLITEAESGVGRRGRKFGRRRNCSPRLPTLVEHELGRTMRTGTLKSGQRSAGAGSDTRTAAQTRDRACGPAQKARLEAALVTSRERHARHQTRAPRFGLRRDRDTRKHGGG